MTCLCRHRVGREVRLQPVRNHAERMWVVSTNLCPLNTQERSDTCSTGGWVGLGAGLVGTESLAPTEI